MPEHLSAVREQHIQPAPAPAGIINYPAENGINPALPPDVIRAQAGTIAIGNIAVSMSTDFSEEVSSIPYSELRVEAILDDTSATLKDRQMAKEESTLVDARDHAINPAVRDPADATLKGRTELNKPNTPGVAKAQVRLKELEMKTARGARLSDREKQERGRLQAEIKALEKSDSNMFRRRKSRKRAIIARKDMVRVGYSEEDIAEKMDDRGEVTSVLKRDTREIKRRSKAEDRETRNQVGRIGKVIEGPDGRRYIVKDVESQPAQGFKVIGYKPKYGGKPHELGDPIFEPGLDPATGEQLPPELHELYTRIEDPAYPDPADPQHFKYELVPRDDPYLGGRVRHAGGDARFFFLDGAGNPVPANPKGISNDSFSPIDDEVILQKLYTGAEAVELILEGSGVDLSDWTIRIGDLAQQVDDKIVKLVDDSDRRLDEHLVFVPSDEVIDPDYETNNPGRSINDPRNMRPKPGLEPGILPPYDLSSDPDPATGAPRKRPSGHFRRFDIDEKNIYDAAGNPHLTTGGEKTVKTSRQLAQEEHLRRVGATRVAANLAKPLAARGKKIPGR